MSARKPNVPSLRMTEPTETDTLLQLNVQDDGDDDESSSPLDKKSTGQDILELAIPAAAALLIDPLMTLADTVFVGRFSEGADSLAGMGSAAALLTFSFYLFNFLCTATTPLVASKRASGLEEDAVAVGGQALSLALGLGATLTMTLLTFRQPLLRIMGTGITGDAANSYALAFLSVRALAAPAVLSLQASTGVLRGYLDTKTPVVILVVANLVNLLLDIILIAFAGLGPMGAAIATTSAEWISAGLLLGVLAGRLPSAGGQVGSNHRTLQGEKVSIVPLLSIPPWEEIKPLIVASSSVFLRSFVLQVSLSAAAAMAARGGDTMAAGAAASVAAHQIGIQLWLLCSFFCDSLAAASQGLVADALGREDPVGVRDISRTVFTYSLALGVFLAALLQIGYSTDWLLDLFTQNTDTRMALTAILPLIILAQPLNALVFAADGVLQGAAEFPFQAKSMALSGMTAVGTFVVLEAGGTNVDMLVHIWTALIALQAMRGLTSVWKIVDSNGPINLLATTK
jgi:putative MATE family efflux protein